MPHGDRSGVVIEPWLTDQWYVDVKRRSPNGRSRRCGTAETRFVPEQLGEDLFPAGSRTSSHGACRASSGGGIGSPPGTAPTAHVFVAESEEEAGAEALAHYVVNGTLSEEEGAAIAGDSDRLARPS